MACALSPTAAYAQLEPEQLYYGINRAVPMRVELADDLNGVPSIELFDAGSTTPIERASVARGRIDLAALFPVLWTTPAPLVRYAQLVVGETPTGPPVVLQPLLNPPRVTDRLSAALAKAFASTQLDQWAALSSLTQSQVSALRQEVVVEPAEPRVYAGLRAWPDRDVIFDTSAGDIRIRLRHDLAPNTAFAFLRLVEGGFYTGTIFHRVIQADARGRPFLIQGGDPTGMGFGGPGYTIDFEPSELPHDFGVLSMARQPLDPNSAGSQFFICLSREACAPLDGLYVAFAQAVSGAKVIDTLARVPVGPIDPADPSSANERPLDPPVIERAYSVPAPPLGSRLPPVKRVDQPVER